MIELISEKQNTVIPLIVKSNYDFSSFSDGKLQYGAFTYGGEFQDPNYQTDQPLVGSKELPNKIGCGSVARQRGLTKGCLETHLHNSIPVTQDMICQSTINGQTLPYQAVIAPHAFHCSDPLCPVCCEFWVRRQTMRAHYRFLWAREHGCLGDLDINHIIVSIPKDDWKLSLEELRKKAYILLLMSGVEGGLVMYHPKRWSKHRKIWFFSPHWHVLGLVHNGWIYGDIVAKINQITGYVVKNKGTRNDAKQFIATLKYQLSHAGVPPNSSHAVTWFGEISYRKMPVPKIELQEIEHETCPLCGNELRPVQIGEGVYGAQADSSILKRKNEGKFCIVSSLGWEYWNPPRRKKQPDPEGG